MDILAAIASDPSVLPLWLVLVFAAGMYPVGMLFGCEVCCNYCVSCCADQVEQVVIDFHLEELGEQVVKQTPWRLKETSYGVAYYVHDPMGEIEDTYLHPETNEVMTPENKWGNVPSFVATGDTSGGKKALGTEIYYVELPPDENSFIYQETRYRPFLGNALVRNMGKGSGGQNSDFVEESVTVSAAGPAEEIEPASLSAVPISTDILGNNVCGESFSHTTLGSYRIGGPFPDYSVFCAGDEGTVIYDVTDGRPEGCNNTCTPGVRREMNHIATSRMENTWAVSRIGPQVQETSVLDVSVPVLAQRQLLTATGFGFTASPYGCAAQHGGDGTVITATAITYWSSFAPGTGGTTPVWCQTVRTYTLDTTEQDCAPFEDWPYTDVTTDSDGEYEDELVRLTIASCFGSGFAGRATEPAGVPGEDDGPITALDIANAGTGYAVRGRVEPTIIVTSVAGTGADLLVTMTEGEDECGRPVWSIDSIAIASGSGDDGGQDYIDGENLSITVEAPGVEVTPAAATARTGREEPELDIYSYGTGSNAEITFDYTENAGPPQTWTPVSATVDSVGSGYQFGEYVDLVPKTAADQSANEYYLGFAQIETLVSEPTVSLSGGSGAGADLPVTLTSNGGSPETWGISAVTILDGGSGYLEGDALTIDRGEEDVEQSPGYVTVSSVDGSGAITAVTIHSAGQYYYESGHVSAVNILEGGQYYRSTGILESVEITDGGSFYLEDEDAPAIVADITVEVEQLSPSSGSGLEVSAIVDDDVHSPTFGQITGLTIDDGGSNYLAIHEEPSVCHVGAPFRRPVVARGVFNFTTSMYEVDDFVGPPSSKPNRGVLFRRRCPDYTYQISLQSGSS